MVRKIITIDEEKCTGCGLCAESCREEAIGIVGGKARLLREDYCDGLGNCLPACPEGAVKFEEREALAFDKAAVEEKPRGTASCPAAGGKTEGKTGGLAHWPVQIKLAPVSASYFNNADLLISASCCAYAYSNFHHDFMKGGIVLIGCPKLDGVDYSGKLSQIIAQNDIKSLTAARMEVPCCGGIEYAAAAALKKSNKTIPLKTFTLSVRGELLTALC
ncbi:MAG: 4Fe-4S binding protein [Spirochaetaceae bacterium]|nr:4Fe-4S binding protein [Spirochaetaceae bacterium]